MEGVVFCSEGKEFGKPILNLSLYYFSAQLNTSKALTGFREYNQK